MLASTHILAGVLIWEMSPGPWWVRVPLSVAGGYVSHYVLDSVATYHDCWPDSWWDVGLVWVQMACVAAVIGAIAARRANEGGKAVRLLAPKHIGKGLTHQRDHLPLRLVQALRLDRAFMLRSRPRVPSGNREGGGTGL